MAKIIRKLDTGEEVKGFQIETELKFETNIEGKALKDNEIEMIGSTGNKDRDGEVIVPKGSNAMGTALAPSYILRP